jgi:hypothetical protein
MAEPRISWPRSSRTLRRRSQHRCISIRLWLLKVNKQTLMPSPDHVRSTPESGHSQHRWYEVAAGVWPLLGLVLLPAPAFLQSCCERDRSDLGGPPRQQSCEPGPMFGAVDLGIADDGQRAAVNGLRR